MDKPDNRGRFQWVKDLFPPLLGGTFFVAVLSFLVWLAARVIFYRSANPQAIAAVFLIPGGVLLATSVYVDKNLRPLARGLLAYVFLSFSFTGMHYLLYIASPRNYSISTAVLAEAEEQRLIALTSDVRGTLRRLGLLTAVHGWAEVQRRSSFDSLLATRAIHNVDDRSKQWDVEGIIISHYDIHFPQAGGIPQYRLEDSLGHVEFDADNGGQEARLAGRLVSIDRSQPEYLRSLGELIEHETKRLRQQSSQLRNLKPERALNLGDFFYFSLITLSTVGFGDIVPNSTFVRLLVVAQVLCGLGMVLGSAHQGRSDVTTQG